MKRFLQWLLRRPVVWLADKLSSAASERDVFSSLNKLYETITEGKTSKGPTLPFDINSGRFIIFSDQHKGGKDLADDFRLAEMNYLKALQHYNEQEFTLINLGDAEELWENTPSSVIEKNRLTLLEEAKFLQQDRYYRIYGNHDLEWSYTIQQQQYLAPIFGDKLAIHEGLRLTTSHNGKEYTIFLAHGHQGDKRSDGNAFSKWVVAAIWTPVQRFLDISINTTADSFELVDRHNIIMYEWSATQRNLVFISGHTHKPVFASLDHIDRLTRQLEKAIGTGDQELIQSIQASLDKRKLEYAGKKLVRTMAHPSYFNTGCCCFSDGDITGIEIADGFIRLVKWDVVDDGFVRLVLEESPLPYIFELL
ncbi:MAG: metallophosphoesterase [Candidatus Pseudobacter hemicellulosilyticus]|uniref:Metallophosphoesterase n=1 Tax=Candidatus Pseudobacter hemicellulosilyticus TaxID=3121375 RepID=A0AAJ5WTN6_9BACT|nr:MAG: metallophosphoesterase [Pseudobacter sp.]